MSLFKPPAAKYGRFWRSHNRDVSFEAVEIIIARWDKKGKLLRILNGDENARQKVLNHLGQPRLLVDKWNALPSGADVGGKLILLVRQIGLGEQIDQGRLRPHLYDWVTEDLKEK